MRAFAVGLVLAGLAGAPTDGAAARTIHIEIRRSRFVPSNLSVPAGAQVRFLVVNRDPIAHEFILGDAAAQLRHESGTERGHDGAPGQASLAAGERQVVQVRLGRAEMLEYACHLPGHYAYGMRGTLEVRGDT
jgi:uncharacterized cupredoxin-like copper-binding protein